MTPSSVCIVLLLLYCCHVSSISLVEHHGMDMSLHASDMVDSGHHHHHYSSRLHRMFNEHRFIDETLPEKAIPETEQKFPKTDDIDKYDEQFLKQYVDQQHKLEEFIKFVKEQDQAEEKPWKFPITQKKEDDFNEIIKKHDEYIKQYLDKRPAKAQPKITRSQSTGNLALSELSSSMESSIDADASVGVGIAGHPVSLTVDGENMNAPAALSLLVNNNNQRTYHGRSTVAVPIVYTIDNTGAWLGANRVRIVYQIPGGAAINQALVFAVNIANHNLPAGVDTFNLVHESNVGVHAHTIRITLTAFHPVTVGLELEDTSTVVNLCHTAPAVGNCANLNYADEITRTRINPNTNLPYLKLVLEVIPGQQLLANIEFVTGPVTVTRSGVALSPEAADTNLALSHMFKILEDELMNNNNVLGRLCPGGGNPGTFVSMHQLIDRYNAAIQANHAAFSTPSNIVLGVNVGGSWRNYKLGNPTFGARANVANANRYRPFQNLYKWRIRCAHGMNALSPQVNIMMPIQAFAATKLAGPNWGAGIGGITHFTDMFPDGVFLVHNNDFAYVYETVQRAQWVATQIVANMVGGVGGWPAMPGGIPQWQQRQFKGWLSQLIMTIIHFTQQRCDVAVRAAGGLAAQTASEYKDHHVNMVKTCIQDGARFFPQTLTDNVQNWWNGGGGTAAILALVNQVGGGAVGNANNVLAGVGPAKCRHIAPHASAAAHFDAQFTIQANLRLPEAFTSALAKANRYGAHESALHLGDEGVADATQFGAIQCIAAVHHTHTVRPFPQINFNQLSFLIESRHTSSPINQGMIPSDDPAQLTNVLPVYQAIRRIADTI